MITLLFFSLYKVDGSEIQSQFPGGTPLLYPLVRFFDDIITAERLSARQLVLHWISPKRSCMRVCLCMCQTSWMQPTRFHACAGLLKLWHGHTTTTARVTWPTYLPALKCTVIQHKLPPHLVRLSTVFRIADAVCLEDALVKSLTQYHSLQLQQQPFMFVKPRTMWTRVEH